MIASAIILSPIYLFYDHVVYHSSGQSPTLGARRYLIKIDELAGSSPSFLQFHHDVTDFPLSRVTATFAFRCSLLM